MEVVKRKRQSKYKARSAPATGFRLQEADFDLLELIVDLRYSTSAMLAYALDRPYEKVNKRCRLLLDCGLVSRTNLEHPRSGGGSRPSIHIVTDAGLKLVAKRRDVPKRSLGESPVHTLTSPLMLPHSLLVSHVAALVVGHVNRTKYLHLVRFQRESVYHRQPVDIVLDGRSETRSVDPDHTFTIQDLRQPEGKQLSHLFLEADRNSMDYTRRMYPKYLAYYQAWLQYRKTGMPKLFGIKSFRVLTVTQPRNEETSDARLFGLMDTALKVSKQQQGSGLFWFARIEDFPLLSENERVSQSGRRYVERKVNPSLPFLHMPDWQVALLGRGQLVPLIPEQNG